MVPQFLINLLWMPSGPGDFPNFSDLIADDTSGVVIRFLSDEDLSGCFCFAVRLNLLGSLS